MNALRGFFLSIVWLALFLSLCSAASLEKKFTPEEQAFIKEHPVIRLGVDPKFIPYEFVDSDGVYKGIAADYIKLISERTGLQLVVEKDLTWAKAYEKGVLKELDALPCVGKTKERERYFSYTEPYYSFQRVIFISQNNNSVKSLDDLRRHTVAVQVNSSHHSFMQSFVPSITLSLYSTVEEGLKAVADGKEEAFVGNLATSSYLAKANGITNLKYVKMEADEKQFLYFAVRNDWPLLVSILNKALADINEEEKIAINNRWIGVENKVDYSEVIKIASMIGAVIVLIFGVSFYWLVKLRREVEARKRIEAALKIAKEEAEYANHIKSAFLARMSHEIRTPLNAISGMAYMIKKTEVSITQKNYLEKITRAARDMLGIINDILDFSKIEAGKIDIERISFNLDEVLQQLVSIAAFKVEEQNIDFSLERDPALPVFFFGDPNRIQQVLLNLVNNAVKFSKDGTVSLSIRLVAKVKDAYRIEFSVKDTGIGMTSEQLVEVFKPFSQGDSSISRRFGGTGLGLSIVKSLVELMGGQIEAYSAVNEGSTFNVLLTLEADRNIAYEEKKKAASLYFRNIRVLVIEKNAFYRNSLKNYLKSFGLVAEFVATEERALELLKAAAGEQGTPYNLLIVDLETPQEGGIQFCSSVKELPWLKETPKFIVMIPMAKEMLLENVEAAGLEFGIIKPIIPSILYNEIVDIFKLNVLAEHDRSAPMNQEEGIRVEYPYHILIVEDNKTNQFIAQSILSEAGFKVTLADNGLEGYEAYGKNEDDLALILMDLHMPVMNGYDATSLIRKRNRAIPIIAMTADAIVGVQEKCQSIGIDHYISKPFEPEKFIETVVQVVKASQAKVRRKEAPEVETQQREATGGENMVLDQADGIRHIGGKAELYRMVLQEYYNENQETELHLQQALAQEDYAAAEQIAHKIKSSSGSIGAKELHEVAAALQKALGNAETAAIDELQKKFIVLLKQVLLEIKEIIS